MVNSTMKKYYGASVFLRSADYAVIVDTLRHVNYQKEVRMAYF